MRILNIIIIIAAMMSLSACQKEEVAHLDLNVSTDKSTYKVGEVVTFKISGNPDQLMFYSGETGHKYIYKDRTQAESNLITLEFASSRNYGSDAQQPRSLRLMASQKFNGVFTAENVNEAADWIDITDAFTLSGVRADGSYLSSGVVNLTALSTMGLNLDISKPIYFAFKYTGVTGSTQPRWWVNKFDINTTTTDGQSMVVTDIAGAGWTQVKVLPTSPVSWVFGTDNTVKFQGGGAAVLSNQVWAMTKGLILTNVQPDRGVPIKDIRDRLDEYPYTFNTKGVYTVTFVGANINVYGESGSTKEVVITITE